MKITNPKRKTTLADSATHCKTIFSKARGLMFSKPLKNKCLIFHFKNETRISLHMMFVFFPIDILFLDSKKVVVDIKEEAKPFELFIVSKKPAKYVIELKNGIIEKSRTKLGDKIKF